MDRVKTQGMLEQAIRLNEDGRLAEAEAICRTLIRMAPKNVTVKHLLGVILCRQDKLKEGAAMLKQAATQAPNQAQIWAHLGDAQHALGQSEDAILSFRRLALLAPTDANAHLRLIISLCDCGRLDEAGDVYARSLADLVPGADTYACQATALHMLDRLEEATTAYLLRLQLVPSDAQAYLNLGKVLNRRKLYAEAMTAFEQVLVLHPQDQEALANMAVALLHQERETETRAILRHILAANPTDRKITDPVVAVLGLLGNKALQRRNPEEALTFFDVVLEYQPDWVEAHCNRGLALQQLGRTEESIAVLRRVLEMNPEHHDALINLAGSLRNVGELEEAVVVYRRALPHFPDRPLLMSNLAELLLDLGEREEAWDLHRAAVRIGENHAQTRFSGALFLLEEGLFEKGWQDYEWRWDGGPPSLKRRAFPQPEWQNEPLNGRTLLVHTEQGYGDTFQFIRFVSRIERDGGKIILESPVALHGLMADVTGIDVLVRRNDPLPAFDVHASLLSLPRLLRVHSEQDIAQPSPYLRVEQSLAETWRPRFERTDARLRVGVVWAGNPNHQMDRLRSIDAATLLDSLRVDGVRLYSLQKGGREGDEAVLAARSDRVEDLGPDLQTFSDTAAAISHLDVVICIDTSVAHLAGALGKTVWLLLPLWSEWRWQRGREDTPWYPSMRLFRQSKCGDWTDVLERVRAELQAWGGRG